MGNHYGGQLLGRLTSGYWGYHGIDLHNQQNPLGWCHIVIQVYYTLNIAFMEDVSRIDYRPIYKMRAPPCQLLLLRDIQGGIVDTRTVAKK